MWPTINSAKLTKENHCLVYPLCKSDRGVVAEAGWKILGKSRAPYPNRLGGHWMAIVFEKMEPRKESILDVLADLEPGIYWCHGDVESLVVEPVDTESTGKGE